MSAELEEERRGIAQQKAQLEEDRRRFTEAAIKLGLEREALQREKDDFINEQRMHATEHLLQGLPKTPQWLKEKLTTQPQQNQLPKTPSTRLALTPSLQIDHSPLSSITTPTACFASYSTINPKLTPGEIITESDTLRTPESANHHYQPGGSRDNEREWLRRNKDGSLLTGNSPATTTMTMATPGSTQSSIKSALRKQSSTPNLSRSVRIAVSAGGRAVGGMVGEGVGKGGSRAMTRTVRPGQDVSKENIEPDDLENHEVMERRGGFRGKDRERAKVDTLRDAPSA
ncbi:hypothetical protein HDV00_008469 [Rhizophlyctis rosea]|nr:hypothetical protein HDV00_008469 [Rhizophlyctis rosea]